MKVHLGVKSDPIESRYSFDWLFDFLGEHRVRHVQLGASLSAFLADDEYFRGLRRKAEKRGVRISSVFSGIREFGGFASGDPLLVAATRRMWVRLVEVAALVGADVAGTNASLTFRDKPERREEGIRNFFECARDLMTTARNAGLQAVATEPMSCTWEFPSTPEELDRFAAELDPWHAAHPDTTVPFLFCGDISHGVADADRRVVYDNWTLFEREIPWMWEFHFKNTDAIFNSTFGFSDEERARGIVDLERLKALIGANASRFPKKDIVGYLEIPGPKVGRDYTDGRLGEMLGSSLDAITGVFG